MFCCDLKSDTLKGPYEQSCYQCRIKNELIGKGRYIFVHESLSGFSLELFCRCPFIHLRLVLKVNEIPLFYLRFPKNK